MALQGNDLGVDGVEDPAGLREEGVFQLVSGSDPVLGSDNCGRCIQIVEGHFSDLTGDFRCEGAAFASVGHDDQTAGLVLLIQSVQKSFLRGPELCVDLRILELR